MTQNVFDKLTDAISAGTGVELTFADIELLHELVGDALAKAGADYEQWREIFEEYERNSRREQPDQLPANEHYLAFWGEFIPAFRRRYPHWGRERRPARRSYMTFAAGSRHFEYAAAFVRPASAPRFRVELYIDVPENEALVPRLFQALLDHRTNIEQAFGDRLVWEALESRRASRIAYYIAGNIHVTDREQWQDIRDWALDHLGRLREAFQPHIDLLRTAS